MRKMLPFLFAVVFVAACSPVGMATGAGATVGMAAKSEGGLSRAVSDLEIQALINDKWFRKDFDMFRKLDMTVDHGRVLITGIVQKPEHRVEAVKLAWEVDGVTQVINEIKVAESTGLTGAASDTWIATKLRARITVDKYVQSINYNIDVVDGNVYLMGTAQNEAELKRVVKISRETSGVKNVVSYVRMLGQPIQPATRPTTAQPQPLMPEMPRTGDGVQNFPADDGMGGGVPNSSYDAGAVQTETLQ
ncbi:MAG: BON domain-containing protein [Alphaproteobacteria bacterium]|nr:BON domain-containing protein [Alphaproteobacteria bacterium]